MEQETHSQTITVKLTWLKKLMQDVYEMRNAQREYFQQPSEYRLRVAKYKEQQINVTLSHAVSKGFITPVKQDQTNQTDLFNEISNK